MAAAKAVGARQLRSRASEARREIKGTQLKEGKDGCPSIMNVSASDGHEEYEYSPMS